ncbi:hypothetical protein BZA77DRAFT_317288 [Pyronema omphalodes]|nr:hypothetical protein BZA77DRAFT_317288 [Pyronema omphalodes]
MGAPITTKGVSAEEIYRQDVDCTPCRIIGSASFVGLGCYTWWSGMRQLNKRELEITQAPTRFGVGIRRLGVHGTAVALMGLGVYRLLV